MEVGMSRWAFIFSVLLIPSITFAEAYLDSSGAFKLPVGSKASSAAESQKAKAETNDVVTKPGEEFKVTFNSNRTTGYEWQLAKPLDANIVEFVSSEYKSGLGRIMGEPGKEVWTFRAVGPGKATVYLKYVRPWEKDAVPANAQAFVVTVKE